MPDVNYDLASKITRAIRALLISVGADDSNNIIAEPFNSPRGLPLTNIAAGDGVEMIECPGLYRFPAITLTLEDDATVQPNQPNPNGPLVAANSRFSKIKNALTQTDTGTDLRLTAIAITDAGNALAVSDGTPEGDKRAADNADMADFTVQDWRAISFPVAKLAGDKGTFWEREISFECVACAAAVALT
jgi:hypothetical protein